MSDHEAKMAAWRRADALVHPRAGEVYTHRNGGLYDVLAVGCDEGGARTPRVAYRSRTYGMAQFRTVAEWEEDVDGRPRYILVPELTTTHGGITMRLIQIRADELAELEAIVARQAAEPGDWRRAREILAAARADDARMGGEAAPPTWAEYNRGAPA
jgi:hypothetical protein